MLGNFRGDEGGVRGEGYRYFATMGVVQEMEKILSHEGLAARKDEDGTPCGVGDLIDEVGCLGCGQLMGGSGLPFAAAVDAAQVAGTRCFPEDDAWDGGDMGSEGGAI